MFKFHLGDISTDGFLNTNPVSGDISLRNLPFSPNFSELNTVFVIHISFYYYRFLIAGIPMRDTALLDEGK